MKKFRVVAIVSTLCVVGDFEADTEQAVIDWAEDNYDPPDVCYQCGTESFGNDFNVERFEAVELTEKERP